jgi:hypothetical protein
MDHSKAIKKGRRSNADLLFYSLVGLNILMAVLAVVLVIFRTNASSVRIPIRVQYNDGVGYGRWWTMYTIPAAQVIFLGSSLVYALRLKEASIRYRTGVMVMLFCAQIMAVAILYRVLSLGAVA